MRLGQQLNIRIFSWLRVPEVGKTNISSYVIWTSLQVKTESPRFLDLEEHLEDLIFTKVGSFVDFFLGQIDTRS